MHILVTADTVGGVWTYARELVTGLIRRGLDVTLVSFGDIPEAHQIGWMEPLRNLDFRPTAFRLEWMQDSVGDIAAASDYLRDVVREVSPDVLHVNQYAFGELDTVIPKVVTAHSDVVSWWATVYGETPPDSAWLRWYRELVLRGLNGASEVVAPSRWMLAQIENHYGAREQARVIYNGRSPRSFNPHGDKENLVLSVGRLWDAAKQVSLLAERDCGWPVVLAGSARHPSESSREDSVSFNPAGKLEVKGSQTANQLQALFARAGIYAATSRYEPFGLAPVEAALSRCAIVANDIPSFREIWGETACYFRTDDPDSLRETIGRLRKDQALRRNYAELAYLRARHRFTADRMVDEYIDLYRSVVPGKVLAA